MSNNDKWRHLFTSDEWSSAMRTSKAIHDSKEKREFWENLLDAKQAQVKQALPLTEKERIAKQYCAMILPVLKAGGQVAVKEIPNPETEFQKQLGKLIDSGEHLPPKK